MVSESRNKFLATTYKPFSRSLYMLVEVLNEPTQNSPGPTPKCRGPELRAIYGCHLPDGRGRDGRHAANHRHYGKHHRFGKRRRSVFINSALPPVPSLLDLRIYSFRGPRSLAHRPSSSPLSSSAFLVYYREWISDVPRARVRAANLGRVEVRPSVRALQRVITERGIHGFP